MIELMASDSTTLCFSGYTVLCAAPDGSIDGGRDGLFHRDTRVVSRWRTTIAGEQPQLVAATQPENDRWQAVLRIPREGGTADGPLLPQDALEIHLRRRVGPGLLEELTVRNHSAVRCDTTLRIEVDGDFRDVAELEREREQTGRVVRAPSGDDPALELRYEAEHEGRHTQRGVRISIAEATTAPDSIDEGGLTFSLALQPGAEWRTTLRFGVLNEGRWLAPESLTGDDGRSRQRATWRASRPALEGSDRLRRLFERSADDLFDLRNFELERRFRGRADGAGWITNAGVPTFTGLFGRDTLTAGWQAALLGSRASRGALDAVAATQATSDDPWRDAEPGKLIHELRVGPLSELGVWPRDAYYGSQTTPAMFLLALSELWHWTADDSVLRRHRDTATRAMEWAERHGDLDGDGFLEYEGRSPRGLRNQGWKDSNEAIRHADGRIADGPIATVEEQAFHFLALERLAEVLVALGEDDDASSFLRRATDLRERWHEAFWMPADGFYALALDGDKRQVASVTSNPGHALGAGIVPAEHARAVADRLLAPDLFSGWGVRSLSAEHPSYNPFAYHLGAVWPVEQATFALGFKRYGLDDHVDRLVEAMFAAAEAWDGRVPEALSGHARDSVPAPVAYPRANRPQAWSASAIVQLVQIMLGLYPFAPLGVLAVLRPRLPAWVPELTIRRLRVGGSSVDLRFERRDDGSAAWRVLGQRGRLLVAGAAPPNGVPEGLLETLSDRAVRAAPGRRGRAARIALGPR
jgi:glycogen debranching enzyme